VEPVATGQARGDVASLEFVKANGARAVFAAAKTLREGQSRCRCAVRAGVYGSPIEAGAERRRAAEEAQANLGEESETINTRNEPRR
jgi:hypothetical protein